MNCVICRQSQLVEGITSVNFERGEMRLVIDDVPAQVCPGCGEAHVSEDVAEQLLEGAEGIYQAGILEDRLGYRELLDKTHIPKFK